MGENFLNGSIPKGLFSLPHLSQVELQNNLLSGEFPVTDYVSANISQVILSNNRLTGPLPAIISQFSGVQKLLLNGPCKEGIANVTHQPHSKSPLSTSIQLLIVLGLLLYFTCDDVLDSLKEDNIIGNGGAKIVYKGAIPNNEFVVVKRLPAMSRGFSHDHGFNAKIQTLGRIKYRHIVRLLGFCSNQETNLLVYEYMPNGSLGEMLYGNKGGHLLWDTRYKIAIEAAKGLCYLHRDCSPLILHRDVKSNNILLDSNFEAHVAHFGLEVLAGFRHLKMYVCHCLGYTILVQLMDTMLKI
ncbi:hypothetical protein Lser_V15G38289 [Lactuca serriola]